MFNHCFVEMLSMQPFFYLQVSVHISVFSEGKLFFLSPGLSLGFFFLKSQSRKQSIRILYLKKYISLSLTGTSKCTFCNVLSLNTANIICFLFYFNRNYLLLQKLQSSSCVHLLEYDQEAGKQWGRCRHTEYKSFLSHIPLKNKINDVSVFYISLIFRLYIHFNTVQPAHDTICDTSKFPNIRS